jgi:glucan phosphoethanolaminetransferase (alkaline phosphatase superfamily)
MTQQRFQFFTRMPWLWTSLLCQMFSVIFWAIEKPAKAMSPMAFLLSFACSLLFWFVIWRLLFASSAPRTRLLLASILAPLVSLLIVINFFSLQVFSSFLTASQVVWAFLDSEYFFEATLSALGFWLILGFVALSAIMIWLWRGKAQKAKKWTLKEGTIFALALLFLLVGTNQLRTLEEQYRFSLDSSFLITLKGLTSAKKRAMMVGSPSRIVPAPIKTTVKPPNIVIIVNESWGKERISFYGFNKKGIMPELEEWVSSSPDEFFVFKKAYSTCGGTHDSMPAIFTGVGAHEDRLKLHRMPFLYDWGRAAGMETIYVSSQPHQWWNFFEFFLHRPPDHFATGESLGLLQNSGVFRDDGIAIEVFIKYIKEADKDKPLLAIYNSGAMHAICRDTSKNLGIEKPFENICDSAHFIVDKAMSEVKKALIASGRYENTIFIITADHGNHDFDFPVHEKIGINYSAYEERVRIPFFVRVPAGLIGQQELANLAQNTDKIVSNIDIVPTVADLIGAASNNQNAQLLSQLKGKNLFRPIPDDRIAFVSHYNDPSSVPKSAFGIFQKQLRFVWNSVEGPQLFDLSNDPKQNNDIWPTTDKKDVFMEQILKYEKLNKMFHRKPQKN